MDIKTTPLELTTEDTFYDIIMKGAHAFSKGKMAEVQHVVIDSTTAFRPEDPQEIDLYASFTRKKPKYISVTFEYDKEHNISDRALHDVLVYIPSTRYKLYARQKLNVSLDEMVYKEPARIRIDAPFEWGITDVSLPKEANWIDVGLLTGILDTLGLRYKQDDHLKVKLWKFRWTPLQNLISTYEFFVKNNFETELVLEMGPITATLKNEKDKQTLKYSICSFLGIGKDLSDGLQNTFERHLSFTASGRPFTLKDQFSELKSKGMKIDYK